MGCKESKSPAKNIFVCAKKAGEVKMSNRTMTKVGNCTVRGEVESLLLASNNSLLLVETCSCLLLGCLRVCRHCHCRPIAERQQRHLSWPSPKKCTRELQQRDDAEFSRHEPTPSKETVLTGDKAYHILLTCCVGAVEDIHCIYF